MGRKILLIGGGGHCRSVIDSLVSTCEYSEIGIVDYNVSIVALEVPVVGTDDDLPRLKKEGWTDAFITIGSIGETQLRRRIYKTVKDLGFRLPIIMDPSAIVGRNTSIDEGVYIGKNAIVNSGSIIGKCAIINSGSIIEHDCCVGEFSHISPGTILCGQVNVGSDSHVGAGSVVRQEINIGNDVLIGIGSVVVNNISDKSKAYGNPCKVVE